MSTQDVPKSTPAKTSEEKDEEREDEEEEFETKTEIRGILGGFVSTKASNDPEMDKQSSSILEDCMKEQGGSSDSKLVGRELASIAEEIEDKLGDRLSGILERIGSPDLAFRSFQQIAIGLFTMNGAVNVTWSRIAAVMGYCYLLCRHFVLRYNNPRAVIGFFTAVVGYLARFIIESRVIQWIHSQGGWRSILQRPADMSLQTVAWVAAGATVIGVGICMWMYLK